MRSRKGTKPLFVFDWDGVIFSSDVIKRVVGRPLKKLGCSPDVFLETAREAVGMAPGYNPSNHAKLIVRRADLSCGAAEIEKIIYDAIEKHPGTFVFPDAKRLLFTLKRRSHPADILTAGEQQFQEYKIVRSRLKPTFRNIHVVRADNALITRKTEVLRRLSKDYGKLLFFDDRVDTIEYVRTARELQDKVLPILVWRKKEKPPRGALVVRHLSWSGIRKIAIHNGFGPY